MKKFTKVQLILAALVAAPASLLATPPPPTNVPELSASLVLLGLGALGLVAFRYFASKGK